MEFYAVATGKISEQDFEMFSQISAVMKEMPNLEFNPAERERYDGCENQMSCHLICRALAEHFEVSVRDGYFFAVGYEHSWLVTKSGLSIIDAYPVAGAMPFIVAARFPSPWNRVYQESANFKDSFTTPQFIERLKRTSQVVSDTFRQLNFMPPPK